MKEQLIEKVKSFIHLIKVTWGLWTGKPCIIMDSIIIRGGLELDGKNGLVRGIVIIGDGKNDCITIKSKLPE